MGSVNNHLFIQINIYAEYILRKHELEEYEHDFKIREGGSNNLNYIEDTILRVKWYSITNNKSQWLRLNIKKAKLTATDAPTSPRIDNELKLVDNFCLLGSAI